MQSFEIGPISRHVEPTDFPNVITAHEKYILKLESCIKTVKERLRILREAQLEGVFQTPSEYDEYVFSKNIVDKVENDRLSKRKEQIFQAEQYKNLINELIIGINKKWPYFWRCVDYLDNRVNNILYWDEVMKSDKKLEERSIFTYNFTNESYLPQDIETLKNIIKRINDTIITAHREYNEYLVENYNNVCTNQYKFLCDCGHEKCSANPEDAITSGCQRKMFWDDSLVDYLNENFTLDSKEPIGFLVFLN